MSDKKIKVLIFGIGGEYYATDIKYVERILEFENTTEVPDAPIFIEGVINYQNEILPIVNLEKKFNLESNADKSGCKVISIKRQEKKFGVVVNCVYEVVDVEIEQVEDTPVITKTANEEYIDGLIKLDEKIIILLNLGNILTKEEENIIFSDK